MILILSANDDPHVPYVLPILEARGADVLWFDPRRFPAEARLTVDFDVRGCARNLLEVDGRVVDLDQVTATWLRRPNPPQAGPEVTDPGLREWTAQMASDALHGALELLGCAWLPAKPRVNRAAHNKLWQLHAAAAVGFHIPRTRVTNHPQEVLDFRAETDARLIGKQTGNEMPFRRGEPVPVYTTVMHRRQAIAARATRHAPSIFQEYVPKRLELRITVVGDRVLAAAIDSQNSRATKDDWRHYDDDRTAYTPYTLPADVAVRCRALCRYFGLSYGAIDMVVTPDGDHVFLEINPNGQWGWIADMTGLPIAAAIADFLLQKEAPRAVAV